MGCRPVWPVMIELGLLRDIVLGRRSVVGPGYGEQSDHMVLENRMAVKWQQVEQELGRCLGALVS